MKQSHSAYRERIAKIRYYLAQLSGVGESGGEVRGALEQIESWITHTSGELPAIRECGTYHATLERAQKALKLPDDQAALLKYTALISYELNRLPYAPPAPKKSFLTRILNPFIK